MASRANPTTVIQRIRLDFFRLLPLCTTDELRRSTRTLMMGLDALETEFNRNPAPPPDLTSVSKARLNTEMEKARLLGMEARKIGKHPNTNPYFVDVELPLHNAWRLGWVQVDAPNQRPDFTRFDRILAGEESF